jgi:quinol monooxygenase YgiN
VSVVVVATLTPKPEHADQVEGVLREVIPLVHAEDGCELYSLHRSPDSFVFVERWASADALKTHSRSPNMADMTKRLGGLMAAPAQITLLDAVPAGDPDKGTV